MGHRGPSSPAVSAAGSAVLVEAGPGGGDIHQPRRERAHQPRTDRLVVKSGGRLFFLRADEIDWVEAAGNYVRLHVGSTSHLLRETMNAIEGRLDPEKFFRIHRSRIVNMERIQELQPWLNGEYAVLLRTGTRLTLSRGYREKLQDRLRA